MREITFRVKLKILYFFQLLFATCCKFNLNEFGIERKPCIYSWFPCTNFIKIMPNLNTGELQTHVSFGENFASTRTKIHEMALAIGLRVWFCASTQIHETARALVSRCAVMFSRETFSRIGATSYQMHANQVRRAPACHFVDYFVWILRLRVAFAF